MINATEARTNVINYEAAILAELDATIAELVDMMSKSIEFHSKNGYTSAAFCPFGQSRFTNVQALEYAQNKLEKIFEEAGYNVIENHYGKNTFKVEW